MRCECKTAAGHQCRQEGKVYFGNRVVCLTHQRQFRAGLDLQWATPEARGDHHPHRA